MMEVDPKALIFRDVFLNQAYTTSVCITNPLTAPVEFTLRPSSPRYTITPNRVNLTGGQSIVVTVRLFLSHYPNYRQGLRGQDDTIHIKSPYFEQKVDVSFFLHNRDASTLASRSRSASPNVKRSEDRWVGGGGGGAAGGADSLGELQNQVHAKDLKIEQLESIIAQLESKYPSLQEIVRNRVEQERIVFEEKSEKALTLLHRKDEIIGQLQNQLQESSQAMKVIREQGSEAAAKRGSHERSMILESAEERTWAIQRVSALEQQLQEAKSWHEAEATAHADVKQRLEKMRQELQQERERAKSVNDADCQREQQHNELRGLRERTIDQAEQIDVLVAEISKLRRDARESGPCGSLSLAQEEISRLQSESRQLRGRMDSLKQENVSLQQALERTNSALKAATARVDEEDQDFRSPARSLKAGHVSWGQVGVGGPQQNEPLLGTPVPSNFNARSFDDVSHALQERTVQVHLYQERADRVEGENDELRARLSDSRQVEHDLRQKCKDLDTRVAGNEIEAKVLAERIERLRSEKEELRLSLEEKEAELRSNAQVSSLSQSKGLEKDAHVWWSYVWHELKRQHLESANISERHSRDDLLLVGADTDQVKISSLRASLSAQAIELASLRQEMLGRKLSFKAEILSLREQADLSQREISRLNALIRTHSGDKEMRLAEMAVTIRSLSSRGDIHTQLASARQELEAEKITAHHLRADIDIYRSMLETEQSKVVALRKEVGQLQGMLDSSSVMKTVTDVPGVEPAVLIELMSGQLLRLQQELAKGNTIISQAQAQINMLQRSLVVERKRSSVEATTVTTREIAAGGQRRNNRPSSSNMEMPPTPLLSEPQADNANLEDTKGDSLQAETSFEDFSSRAAVGSFSILIDGECTPQKVLDSLDIASLTHQIQLQENCIAHLRAEVAALSAEATLSETARFHDKEQNEQAYRIDFESSLQKLELLQISLDEAKAEIATLRQENSELEKSLIDIQISSTIAGMLAPRSRSSGYGVEHDSNLGDSTFIDTSDLREEHESTKTLLRERTTQLKIIMETLDALHVAGIKERDKENDENVFLGNLQGGNLAMLASAPLPSVEGSWGLQSLVKRVVELTAELTSQCATASLEERRANQLEEENRRNARLLNKLRTQLRDGDESVGGMQIQIAMLSDRLKESETCRVDASSKHRNEFDELLSALRDAETKLTTFQVTINELRQQVALSERDGSMDWIDHILSVGIPQESEKSEPTMEKNDENVRDMVATLVTEWKFSASSQPMQLSKGRMSKSEQRFMQRVADLVSESSRICNKALTTLHQAQIQKDQAERKSTVMTEKLKAALQYLHQSKNRTHSLEQIVRNDSRSSITQCEHLKSFLRKSMLEERRNASEARRMLMLERRDHKLQELKKATDAKKVFSLQQRIAELESRGSATLRGRDEATAALESRVKSAEESMHRWFKTELPRLISGLPLTEDTMGGNFDPDSRGGQQSLDNNSHSGLLSSGLDRTFALAQALCCSKASSTVQDMKLVGALEKNSILKNRVIELESVLTRWKDDIQKAGLAVEHSKELGVALNAQDREKALYATADAEGALLDRTQQLTSKLLELEEESIIASGRLEHSLQRNEELKKLIDSIMLQEDSSRVKMSRSVSQMRSNLEQEHALELRNIREAYECDKKDLMDELEKVLETVDSPHVHRNVRPTEKPTQQTRPTQSNAAAFDFVPAEGGEVNEGAGRDESLFFSTDPSNEVGSRIRLLLTQLSTTSTSSQRLYSQQIPVAEPPAEDASTALDNSRMQDEIRSLESALESERTLYRDARAEITELEQLLSAQRNAFSERIQGSPVPTPIQSGSRGESPGSPPPHARLEQTYSADDVKKTASPVLSLQEVKSFGEGSTPGGEDSKTLRSLLEQVQTLETRLSAEKVPESSIVLLRELRSRVSEMESSMNESVERQQANWDQERKALNQALLESSTLFESLRAGQEEVSSSIRRRYEDALSQAQEALEQQTTAAAAHVGKLEEFVRGSQAQSDYQKEQVGVLAEQIAMKEAAIAQMSETIKSQQDEIHSLQQQTKSALERSQIDSTPFSLSAPHLHVPPPHAPPLIVSDSQFAANSSLEELIKLQRLLDRTSDDLERSNKKLRDAEDKHAKEIAVLINQCNVLKRENSVRATKTARSVSSDQAGPPSRSVGISSDANERTRDLEEQLRRMDYRFRMKTAELDAIVASLSKTGGVSTVDGSFLYGGDGSAEDESSLPSSFADVSSLPIGMKHQIIEVRLQAAEGEVETLQSLLSKERKESFLALKLQKLATATRPQTTKQDLRGGKKDADPEPHQTPSRSRTPLKLKEQRAVSPQKSPRHGDDSSKSTGGPPPKDENMAEKERVLNEEIATLRLQLGEARTQVQILRDDLVRKSRLIASLKAARQAEGSSADHWRAEAQNHEETSKRLQRSVSSKDAIIKDLRSKIGLQQTEEMERDIAGHPVQSAASSEAGQPPPADLKSRLKAAEVERSRARSRLSVIRDRLAEAEIEIKELKEENGQLAKAYEKAESLRISLARKEAQCRSLKAQADQQRVAFDATLLEAENKTRQTSRQLETLEKSFKDLQRQNNGAKARLSVAPFPTLSVADPPRDAPLQHQQHQHQRYQQHQQHQERLQQQQQQAHSHSEMLSVPSSIGSSASSDLAYIMSTLGLSSE